MTSSIRGRDRTERATRAWFSALASCGLAGFVNEQIHVPWWGHAIMIATGTAGGSFGLSFIAKRFGERGTASFVKGIGYE